MEGGRREEACEKTPQLRVADFVDSLGGGLHSLAWVSWCLSSFERWLKAFPQAVQS